MILYVICPTINVLTLHLTQTHACAARLACLVPAPLWVLTGSKLSVQPQGAAPSPLRFGPRMSLFCPYRLVPLGCRRCVATRT